MVYLLYCVWEFIKGGMEKKKYIVLLLYHSPFIVYIYIGIKLVFHFYFNKGMIVPPTFGRNT